MASSRTFIVTGSSLLPEYEYFAPKNIDLMPIINPYEGLSIQEIREQFSDAAAQEVYAAATEGVDITKSPIYSHPVLETVRCIDVTILVDQENSGKSSYVKVFVLPSQYCRATEPKCICIVRFDFSCQVNQIIKNALERIGCSDNYPLLTESSINSKQGF